MKLPDSLMLEDEEDEDELNVDRFRFEEGGGGR